MAGSGILMGRVLLELLAHYKAFASARMRTSLATCAGREQYMTIFAITDSLLQKQKYRRCRSLRNDSSWWWGIFTGLAYTYMVMVWGGYIFVLNMIGVHAGVLWITGCHSTKLHR